MRRTLLWALASLGILLLVATWAIAGPRHAAPLAQPSAAPHPDDIYWDNEISRSLPGVNGTVHALTIYEGKLVVAGFFSIAGGTTANNIATWDGTAWSSLAAGLSGQVSALTVYEDRLIAGGSFRLADGAPGDRIAAWDGHSWSALGTGMNAEVSALTVYHGQLIAGGRFTRASATQTSYVAAWDGDAWSSLGAGSVGELAGTDSWVNALTVFDDRLIAGGLFRRAGASAAERVASWDGTSWSPLGTGMDKSISALVVHGDALIAGGAFDVAGGVEAHMVAAWNGIEWSPMDAGIDPGDPTNTGIRVDALTVFNGQLVVGGRFALDGDPARSSIAAWDGTSWSGLSDGVEGHVHALAVHDDGLIAGGTFTFAGGVVASRVAKWDRTAWSPVSEGTGVNGFVAALGLHADRLVAAGYFTHAGGARASLVAAWDGTSWAPLGPGIPGGVVGIEPTEVQLHAIASYNGMVIAGGLARLQAWDGSTWMGLGEGVSNPGPRPGAPDVRALIVYENRLIVAGDFRLAGGNPASNIAAWDGTSWSALGSGLGGPVRALAVYEGELVAAGLFGTAGDSTVSRIAAWDGTSWSPLGAGVNRAIGALTVYDGRLIAGGRFTASGELAVNHIAAWDGTSWSALGAGTDDEVMSLGVYDDKLIAGLFAMRGSNASGAIAAWDGASWSPLGSGVRRLSPNLNTLVLALAEYRGDLIVGGLFSLAGGKLSLALAEWTRRDFHQASLDVHPGSCRNPVNGNSAHGRGKAVLHAAILGTAGFDVRDVDPSSVALNGVPTLGWSYRDVGASRDESESECTCSTRGPDGLEDLRLTFSSADVAATLSSSGEAAVAATRDDGRRMVYVEGRLRDGSQFRGVDCVELVGRHASGRGLQTAAVRGVELSGNHPNPFGPSTTISFYLPAAFHVRLEVFNVLGQRVTTLIDGRLDAGDHSVIWTSTRAAAGRYYYRLQAGDHVATGNMLLIK